MKKLLVLAVLLSGCGPSATNVRVDGPAVEGLTSSDATNETETYVVKVTRWWGGSDRQAWLRVVTLKQLGADQRMMFTAGQEANTFESSLDAAYSGTALPSANVVQRGRSSNRLGALEYALVGDPEAQCVYFLQFTGTMSNAEYSGAGLGDRRVEGWYCEPAMSRETAEAFVASVTY